MGRIWSKTKKQLEEDFLCESLRGRVQYFYTHYHGAPDNYGRFCVRVDGKEYVHANPYNEIKTNFDSNTLKEEYQVPTRVWEHGKFLYEEENCEIEEIAERIAMEENRMEIWQVLRAINEYLDLNINDAIYSENPVIRMLAVMDRRVGKRTLKVIGNQIEEQPEWLQFFYRLRLDAENLLPR